MDEIARIWQRVAAPGPEPAEDMAALLEEAALLLEYYRQLPQSRERLRLTENQRFTLEGLRGIRRLRGDRGKEPPRRGTAPKTAEDCFHRSRYLMAEFSARAASPQTGCVFGELSELQRQNSFLLARLLGRGL